MAKAALIRFLMVVALVVICLFVFERAHLISMPVHFGTGPFAIEPYLQLGRTGKTADVEIIWGSTNTTAKWTVQSKVGDGEWGAPVEVPQPTRISVQGVDPFSMFHCVVPGGVPDDGHKWAYRVMQDGKLVFEAPGTPLHANGDAFRFDVIGDTASGTLGQKAVASALWQLSKPEMLLIAGDIVYMHGRLSEYLASYFPIFNADTVSANGVPMARSTIFVAAPGNHDTARGAIGESSDLNLFPDGLAYYDIFRQPLDGPKLALTGPNTPRLRGGVSEVDAFMRAADENFPRMGNFSYDYGNAHFTILDANLYMNWKDPTLRKWLDDDLKQASKATWKFVMFHQPPFSSDLHHYKEQQMRLVADVFQQNHVDVVFSGHVHNYQRTRPIKFTISKEPDDSAIPDSHLVDGRVDIDQIFDGETNTKPNGVIYVVTGCGGASLVEADTPDYTNHVQQFTAKVFPQFSYTQCDINGKTLLVQQLDPTGKVLDKFEITK
jgi:hypothetical protein